MAFANTIQRKERLTWPSFQHRRRKLETITVELDKRVVEQLKLYASFIDSTQEHVVNEALAFTFRKDRAFQGWLDKPKPAGVSNGKVA